MKEVCAKCGKEFKNISGLGRHTKITHGISSKEYYDRFLKKEDEDKCKTCGKETKFRNWGTGYLDYCSTKCANLDPKVRTKIENTHIERTGYKHNMLNPVIKKKIQETCLERYGTKHAMINNKIKEKSRTTCLERYGVEYSFQSENNKKKSKETCLKKYGVENPSKSKQIKDKISKGNKKHHEENFKKNILPENYELLEYNIKDEVKMKCDKGHTFQCQKQLVLKRNKAKHVVCTVCQPLNSFENGKSKAELELSQFIKGNCELKIETNTKDVLSNLELDIYIPELKLAFEFNGLYWHSELYKHKNYHLEKTERCLNKNIQLIHVFEDDWLYKQDIVKSRILNLLGKNKERIYARKCKISIIDAKETKEFLEDNHIQGYVTSTINIGLRYNDELVSLLTAGPGRFYNTDMELLRFCNKRNTSVIGAASKLFKYLCLNYEFKKIVTYADRNWSNGNLYNTLGFKYIKKTVPGYYYVVDGIRMNRFKFRKSALIEKGYDENKTADEILHEMNIYKIYDSGNLKFSYEL